MNRCYLKKKKKVVKKSKFCYRFLHTTFEALSKEPRSDLILQTNPTSVLFVFCSTFIRHIIILMPRKSPSTKQFFFFNCCFIWSCTSRVHTGNWARQEYPPWSVGASGHHTHSHLGGNSAYPNHLLECSLGGWEKLKNKWNLHILRESMPYRQ